MLTAGMANKKNKTVKNRERHVYIKKNVPRKKVNAMERTDTQMESDTNKTTLEGSRIINIDKLKIYTDSLTAHSARCDGRITLSGETRDGLASILMGHCSTCNHSMTLETSQKVKGPRGYKRWECNLAAVWGQMTTGGGHTNLQDTMSVVGVPVMTKATFVNTERDIGEWWKRELQASMIEAGKEERQLAVEKGNYHEGVPAITVILDGGWSKRTHKHSYNAKSGVAIIIGKELDREDLIHRCPEQVLRCLFQEYSQRSPCLLQELDCFFLGDGNRLHSGGVLGGGVSTRASLHSIYWGWRQLGTLSSHSKCAMGICHSKT